MALLLPLDVIIIPDDTITPPAPKMVVCIHPDEGWFYRINSNPWRPPVLLVKEPHHSFLQYDSYLECGDPLELSDYVIEEALKVRPPIGRVHKSVCPAIIAALTDARYLKAPDKAAIIAALA